MKQLCPRCGRTYESRIELCPEDDTRLVADLRDESLGGRYKLETLVGIGGMESTVWRAWQTTTHRTVAVKVLPPADDAAAARFARGARIASNLNHPHITTVHDYGRTEDNHLYLVMEFLEGHTLSRFLKRQKSLSVAKALHVTDQTLRALEHAHKQSVVHRDLKPANLFLTSKDDDPSYTKVLDFGIAKYVVGESPTVDDTIDDVTKDHRLCGTPRYMAPEQIACSVVDSRADLYSLSVVLFRMLTGELPFDGRTSYELLTKHLSARPRPFSEVAPEKDIPDELEQIVMKALAKSPDERFQSAREMRNALRLIRHGMGIFSEDTESSVVFLAAGHGQNSTGPMPTDQSTSAAVAPRRRSWIPIVIAAAILLGVGAWWLITQSGLVGDTVTDDGATAQLEQDSPPPATGAEGSAEDPPASDQPASPADDKAPAAGDPAKAGVGTTPTAPGEAAGTPAEVVAAPAEVGTTPPADTEPKEGAEPAEPDDVPLEIEPDEVVTAVTVKLASDPSGALVKQGRDKIGHTPLELELAPDRYELTLSLIGHRRTKHELDLTAVAAGEIVEQTVLLKAAGPRTARRDKRPKPPVDLPPDPPPDDKPAYDRVATDAPPVEKPKEPKRKSMSVRALDEDGQRDFTVAKDRPAPKPREKKKPKGKFSIIEDNDAKSKLSKKVKVLDE